MIMLLSCLMFNADVPARRAQPRWTGSTFNQNKVVLLQFFFLLSPLLQLHRGGILSVQALVPPAGWEQNEYSNYVGGAAHHYFYGANKDGQGTATTGGEQEVIVDDKAEQELVEKQNDGIFTRDREQEPHVEDADSVPDAEDAEADSSVVAGGNDVKRTGSSTLETRRSRGAHSRKSGRAQQSSPKEAALVAKGHSHLKTLLGKPEDSNNKEAIASWLYSDHVHGNYQTNFANFILAHALVRGEADWVGSMRAYLLQDNVKAEVSVLPHKLTHAPNANPTGLPPIRQLLLLLDLGVHCRVLTTKKNMQRRSTQTWEKTQSAINTDDLTKYVDDHLFSKKPKPPLTDSEKLLKQQISAEFPVHVTNRHMTWEHSLVVYRTFHAHQHDNPGFLINPRDPAAVRRGENSKENVEAGRQALLSLVHSAETSANEDGTRNGKTWLTRQEDEMEDEMDESDDKNFLIWIELWASHLINIKGIEMYLHNSDIVPKTHPSQHGKDKGSPEGDLLMLIKLASLWSGMEEETKKKRGLDESWRDDMPLRQYFMYLVTNTFDRKKSNMEEDEWSLQLQLKKRFGKDWVMDWSYALYAVKKLYHHRQMLEHATKKPTASSSTLETAGASNALEEGPSSTLEMTAGGVAKNSAVAGGRENDVKPGSTLEANVPTNEEQEQELQPAGSSTLELQRTRRSPFKDLNFFGASRAAAKKKQHSPRASAKKPAATPSPTPTPKHHAVKPHTSNPGQGKAVLQRVIENHANFAKEAEENVAPFVNYLLTAADFYRKTAFPASDVKAYLAGYPNVVQQIKNKDKHEEELDHWENQLQKFLLLLDLAPAYRSWAKTRKANPPLDPAPNHERVKDYFELLLRRDPTTDDEKSLQERAKMGENDQWSWADVIDAAYKVYVKIHKHGKKLNLV
ncbi:unnamed protein product [Amoebophrya sp. A120]|nr:unnamed protein product [Amoebophrya sp. A120]|eukprot:GSA120T00013479001.1